MSSERRTREALPVALVAVGVALRLLELARAHALWIDEVRVAFNLALRSFSGLLEPLSMEQVAPPLFLLLSKLVTLIFGMSDEALRAVPCFASALSVPATLLAARAIAKGHAPTFAVAVVAFSPLALRYSAELKPYGLEVLASALTIWSARVGLRRLAPFIVTGSLLVLTVMPAPFILAPAGTWLFWRLRRDGRDADARRVLVASLAWAAAFLTLYALIYVPGSSHPMMKRFWEMGFLVPGHALERGAKIYFKIVETFFAPPLIAPKLFLLGAPVAVLAGVVVLERRERGVGLMLLAPAALALGASAMERFVIVDRLVLFTLPSLAILAAVALEAMCAKLSPRRAGWLFFGVAAIVLGRSVVTSVDRHAKSAYFVPMSELVRTVRADLEAGRVEGVYVTARGAPEWVFYTTDWSAPDLERIRWLVSVASADGPLDENLPSRAQVDASAVFARPIWGGVELFGAPTGAELRYVRGLLKTTPDEGFMELELSRIAGLGGPFWLVTSHDHDDIARRLGAELRAREWKQERFVRTKGARAWRYAPPTASVPR